MGIRRPVIQTWNKQMLQCREAAWALSTPGGKAPLILPGHSEETSHSCKEEIQGREEENQGVSTLVSQDARRLQTSQFSLLCSLAAAVGSSKKGNCRISLCCSDRKIKKGRLNYTFGNYWQWIWSSCHARNQQKDINLWISKHKLHELCSSKCYPSTAHWNHFGNACLQEVWILLCRKKSPESSGWAQIGSMFIQQGLWKEVPAPPWTLRSQEMLTGIFKLALEMLPAWFLEDSSWSSTLSAFLHLLLGREKWTAHALHLWQRIYNHEVHLHIWCFQLLHTCAGNQQFTHTGDRLQNVRTSCSFRLGELSHGHRIPSYVEPFLSVTWDETNIKPTRYVTVSTVKYLSW